MTTNQLKFAELEENKRANRVREEQGFASIAESKRHNLETERTNWYSAQSNYDVGSKQAQAALQNAAAMGFNAQTNRLGQQETVRHNTILEDQGMKQTAQTAARVRQQGDEVSIRKRAQDLSESQWNDGYKQKVTMETVNGWISPWLNVGTNVAGMLLK